jgi:hypothetical protein
VHGLQLQILPFDLSDDVLRGSGVLADRQRLGESGNFCFLRLDFLLKRGQIRKGSRCFLLRILPDHIRIRFDPAEDLHGLTVKDLALQHLRIAGVGSSAHPG